MGFLTRWDPWRELERLTRVLDETPRGGGEMTMADWAPRVDVKETPEEFLIQAELPGIPKEDVKLSVKDGAMTLRGERHQEREDRGVKFHRVERLYGSFMRSFTLPEGVDESKVVAEHKNGMLTVHLPKSKERPEKAVEIAVQ